MFSECFWISFLWYIFGIFDQTLSTLQYICFWWAICLSLVIWGRHYWSREKVNLCCHADLSLVTQWGAKWWLVNIYRLITACFMWTLLFFCQFVRLSPSQLPSLHPTFDSSVHTFSSSLIFVFPSSSLLCSTHLWSFMTLLGSPVFMEWVLSVPFCTEGS